MTIKLRISLFVSLLFTVIFGIASIVIVMMFSNFRKEEFQERLRERALTSIKLLIEVKEVDHQMLRIIDKNTINKLYDDKTLIFNSKQELIYSSLDDTKITWSKNDLMFLKKNKTLFKKSGNNEVYGIDYTTGNEEYYALISANDNYGKRKLDFLIYLVIGVFFVANIIAWILSFSLIKKELLPLTYFIGKVKAVNANNLDSRIEISSNAQLNEISQMTDEFNYMLKRIEDSYRHQREFTSQASHELRTPLARISFQIENQLQSASEEARPFLNNLFNEVNQLNNLIYSLLILANTDGQINSNTEKVRIDEVVYSCIENLRKFENKVKVNFKINGLEHSEIDLDIPGSQNLIEIALFNLIKNAFLYSESGVVEIEIKRKGNLMVIISNIGATIPAEEQKKLYLPFMRGSNSSKKEGIGLGLRIVQRILNSFGHSIEYKAKPYLNIFTITFKQ
jgi:two-component system sensor histidine kinase ArlS